MSELARLHTAMVPLRIIAGVDAATLIVPMKTVARTVLKENAKSFIVGGVICTEKHLVLRALSIPAVAVKRTICIIGQRRSPSVLPVVILRSPCRSRYRPRFSAVLVIVIVIVSLPISLVNNTYIGSSTHLYTYVYSEGISVAGYMPVSTILYT